MPGKIKGITIEIDGNTKGLTKALKEANVEIKEAKSNLKSVERALKLDPKNVDMLKAKQNALNEVITETKKKLDIEKQAAESAKKELELGNITQSEYDALQAEIVTTTDELKKLESQAKQSASVLSSQMKAAGEDIKKVGESVSNVGKNMTTKITAPVVAATTSTIAAFNEVDKGMDSIAKKTGKTGKELENFENIAKDIAQTIPTSFEIAGAAVGEVNTKFGVTGKELNSLSSQFVKFAELNDTDVSDSIDSVKKVMSAFNLDVSQTGALLDTLNATGQNTGITMNQLTSLMVTNAASLQQMGFSAASAATFLGNVEMSGADTSQVMSGLTKALKNATESGKPLDVALEEIQSSMMNAKSETEGLQAAYDLFGTKAGAAIYQACKNGSLNFNELSTSMIDNIGNINSTYDAMIDDTDKLTTTLNALKVTASEIGATMAESLAPILESLTGKIRQAGEGWENLSDNQKEIILTVTGIIAILGPVLIVLGKIITSVGTIVTAIGTASGFITGTLVPAISSMITTITPFLSVAAAVIAVIVAVITVIKNWDAIVELAGIIWETFTNKVSQLVQSFKTFFTSAFQAIGDFFKNIWNNIVSVAQNAWSSIQNAFSAVGSWFTNIFQQAWNGITGIFNKLGGFFSGVWNGITGIFKNAGIAIGDAISGAVRNAVNFVLSKAIGIINGFIGAINAAIGVINKIPGVSLSKISTLGIPQLERGGVLSKGQIGLLEGNGAEAVVPLDQNEKWIAAVAKEFKNAMSSNGAAAAACGDIIIPVYIGRNKLDSILVKANQVNNYRSGGR